MGLLLALGIVALLGAVAALATLVPRRLRWRGDVRPRRTVRLSVGLGDFGGPPRILARAAAEERWGVTSQLDRAVWVRQAGQLRWHQAVAILVDDGAGLVVDPTFSPRRKYIFDGTCLVGPSSAAKTFNPGQHSRRDFGLLRVSQGTQVIDLAVPEDYVSAVEGVGTSAPLDEPTVAPVGRLALIARLDRTAARRQAFFARVNARSRTSRAVSAMCSLFYLALAVAVVAVADLADDHRWTRALSAISSAAVVCVIAAFVYARRAVVPRHADSVSDGS